MNFQLRKAGPIKTYCAWGSSHFSSEDALMCLQSNRLKVADEESDYKIDSRANDYCNLRTSLSVYPDLIYRKEAQLFCRLYFLSVHNSPTHYMSLNSNVKYFATPPSDSCSNLSACCWVALPLNLFHFFKAKEPLPPRLPQGNYSKWPLPTPSSFYSRAASHSDDYSIVQPSKTFWHYCCFT